MLKRLSLTESWGQINSIGESIEVNQIKKGAFAPQNYFTLFTISVNASA